MNGFLQTQLQTMLLSLRTFEQGCELAARKDDGKIDRAEEKQLKAIRAAILRFRRELERIQ